MYYLYITNTFFLYTQTDSKTEITTKNVFIYYTQLSVKMCHEAQVFFVSLSPT